MLEGGELRSRVSVLLLLIVAGSFALTLVRADEPEITLPPWVKEAGERFLQERLGKDFFESCVSLTTWERKEGRPDCGDCESIHQLPHYNLRWDARIAEKPFARVIYGLDISPDGYRVKASPWAGVPDCIKYPEACEFRIDEVQAKKIAQEVGLEEGLKQWRTRFKWSREHQAHVWYVSNTLEIEGTRETGRVAVIDATDGTLITFNRHMAIGD